MFCSFGKPYIIDLTLKKFLIDSLEILSKYLPDSAADEDCVLGLPSKENIRHAKYSGYFCQSIVL